jgi:flagellar biogenesis protein FliO
MSWLSCIAIAAAGTRLVCTAVSAAPSTAPAVAGVEAPVLQGKYENKTIARHSGDASQASATATTQGSEKFVSSRDLDIPRVAAALGIVLALILVMRWAGRKFFPSAGVPRSGGAMKVLSRLVISPKQQLLMVQVGRRIVVIGDSSGQMSAVSEIADPDEVGSLVAQIAEEKSQHSFKGFGAMFNRAGKNFDEKMEHTEVESPSLTPTDSPSVEQASVDDARGDINELADKVRLLSAQFRGQA